jgi:hypothetical protein
MDTIEYLENRLCVIKQVAGGFICEVEGQKITREMQTFMGTRYEQSAKIHQFVFTDEIALYTFLHFLFFPTSTADSLKHGNGLSSAISKQVKKLVAHEGFGAPQGLRKLEEDD